VEYELTPIGRSLVNVAPAKWAIERDPEIERSQGDYHSRQADHVRPAARPDRLHPGVEKRALGGRHFHPLSTRGAMSGVGRLRRMGCVPARHLQRSLALSPV